MTTFPIGTVVVKDIMDDTNTAVAENRENGENGRVCHGERVAIQRRGYSSLGVMAATLKPARVAYPAWMLSSPTSVP